jgi:hypothetical protein
MVDVSTANGFPYPALNAGTIGMKCFINRSCPFTYASRDEMDIVFNERTLSAYTDLEGKFIHKYLTGTPNTEGIHFVPKYVYRHGYIYTPKESTSETAVDVGSIFFEDFDSNFDEIENGRNIVDGVNEVRYKAEQSWVVVPSVFDKPSIVTSYISDDVKAQLCGGDTIWAYNSEIMSSQSEPMDKKFDYKTQYYNTNSKTIDANNIQMPRQFSARNQAGIGNHWRLEKRTPLYKGEDFFFYFKPMASSPNTPNTDTTNMVQFQVPLLTSPYSSLDVFNDPVGKNLIDIIYGVPSSQYSFKDNIFHRNSAVLPLKKDEDGNIIIDKEHRSTYYFYDQCYYIVELGVGDPENNYFIILCERGNPLFVQVYNHVSLVISECETVSAKSLITSNQGFRMTVRNHLGKLVIYFDTETTSYDPWVITYTSLDGKTDQPLYVPRGHITLWGGNQQSGFLFGPLQYTQEGAFILYPPGSNNNLGNSGSSDRTFTMDMTKVIPTPKWISLPLKEYTDHHVLLTCSPLVTPDLIKTQKLPKIKNKSNPLYTQDSQYYFEENESSKKISPDVDNIGYFFWDQPIKEFCLNTGPSSFVKDSYIKVRKWAEQIDSSRKLSNFNIEISLKCGDHVFDAKYGLYQKETPKNRLVRTKLPSLTAVLDDTYWYLPDCKTPILTQIRIVADNSLIPRWNDGTTIENGVYRENISGAMDQQNEPFLPSHEYAIDATDYLMLYNENSTASDFFTIEHTSTLTFLLNKKNTSVEGYLEKNQIIEKIENLKDKAFYVEIWAKYEPLFNSPRTNSDNAQGLLGYIRLFTGLCHGGSIETTIGSKIMTCKASDYMKVLKDQYFYNSPFFDGMNSSCAVYEILTMAGFREKGDQDPANILSKLSLNSKFMAMEEHKYLDGRTFIHTNYALPSGYSRLEQPAYKFTDGSNYYDAIAKICNDSGKCFYFDQFGVAHFENYQDLVRAAAQGTYEFEPIWKFTTNPNINPGQMIYKKTDRGHDVNSVYNHLKVVSNTPSLELLILDDVNDPSYTDPNTEGFLGYRKSFIQHEGMYGSEVNAKDQIIRMKPYFRPPINLDFETYGVPIRALDFVKVDDEIVRVMSVDSNFDPKDNKWYMTVKCERYLPNK